MADHEFDFSAEDSERTEVRISDDRVAVRCWRRSGEVELVWCQLPPGVAWHDERAILDLPADVEASTREFAASEAETEPLRPRLIDVEDWKARYSQLWRAYTARLRADEGLTERLMAAEAHLAELVPWARGGAAWALVDLDRHGDRTTSSFDPETLERVDGPGARELLERLDAGEFDR